MNADNNRCSFGAESQYVDLAAEVFSLLSDATRLRIIMALDKEELSVTDLADKVGKSPTVVSQHLAKLRWAKIVRPRREGTRIFYVLIDEHVCDLVSLAVFQAGEIVGGIPEHPKSVRNTSLPKSTDR